MRLKSVLHIKIQFVRSDLMVVNNSFQKAEQEWTQQASLCPLVVDLWNCRGSNIMTYMVFYI